MATSLRAKVKYVNQSTPTMNIWFLYFTIKEDGFVVYFLTPGLHHWILPVPPHLALITWQAVAYVIQILFLLCQLQNAIISPLYQLCCQVSTWCFMVCIRSGIVILYLLSLAFLFAFHIYLIGKLTIPTIF